MIDGIARGEWVCMRGRKGFVVSMAWLLALLLAVVAGGPTGVLPAYGLGSDESVEADAGESADVTSEDPDTMEPDEPNAEDSDAEKSDLAQQDAEKGPAEGLSVPTKVGWQNPFGYPQVSSTSVELPSYATGYHTFVMPSRIPINATREQCVEAFIACAFEYARAKTPFREPWSQAPGIGTDCSGLVLQCLYATGMDLEHARGTQLVGGFNPYNHYLVPAQTFNSMRWYENNTFMPVSPATARRGDLIFYDGHVAIYLGNNRIIHANGGSDGGVLEAPLHMRIPIGAQRPFI